MENYNGEEHVNIGTGEEISIGKLAELVKDVVGFEGTMVLNIEKPDGIPRKLTDVSRLHGLGWQHQVSLRVGIVRTYRWFRKNYGLQEKVS